MKMSKGLMTWIGFGAGAASILVAVCSAAFAGPAANAPSAAQSAPQRTSEDLRNARYCEVLTIARQWVTFLVNVYNTTGLNLCPAERWQALDANTLAKQLGVTAVRLNGPRYWTLDGIEAKGSSASGQKTEFGGIAMTLRATLKVNLGQGTVGDTFYKANQVLRTTDFHYRANAPVYELISPSGDVYMMQSYAQIADPKLSLDDLPRLGERLKLPAGWKYQTRTLDSDYALTAEGVAYVIQDDLYNSYQRRPK